MRIYNFDIRLKWSLKQGNCPLQRPNFIRDLGLFLFRHRMSGHAVRTPLKGMILGVIAFLKGQDTGCQLAIDRYKKEIGRAHV